MLTNDWLMKKLGNEWPVLIISTSSFVYGFFEFGCQTLYAWDSMELFHAYYVSGTNLLYSSSIFSELTY